MLRDLEYLIELEQGVVEGDTDEIPQTPDKLTFIQKRNEEKIYHDG